MNTTGWLIERFAEFNRDPALIWRGETYTYQSLLEGVHDWRAELDRCGVQQGESVAFFGDYSPRTCTLMLALVANGNIVVPLTRAAMGKSEKLLDIAHVEVTIEFDVNDSWSLSRREAPSPLHELISRLRGADEPGLVVFTSGSTGEPKGVIHSFNLLFEKFRKRRRKIRSLVFLLLDHLGGINTLLHILSCGGTAAYVEDRRPETICQAIQDHRIEVLPATPTFLTTLLMSDAHQNYDLTSLTLITYGTEPMPESTLAQLARAFPHARPKQTYGLTELGVFATKSRDSKTLWMKIGGEGLETKVVDGKLWVRSQTPMLGYLNAPSPFDEDGWYNTEDEVRVDGEYLQILGRVSDIINVGGEKVYPAEVESVLLEMDNIQEVAVRGRRNPVTGNVVVATISLATHEDPAPLKRRIWQHCSERGLPRFKIPVLVELLDKEQQRSERFKKVRRDAKGT